MTYQAAREFIRKEEARGGALGLTNMKNLMDRLGNVQDALPVIHITGTNGKGSVGAYLYGIFHEAGLRVGRYFSPAVFDPLEIWQYEGQPISKSDYAKVMTRIEGACRQMKEEGLPSPTVFEIETAAAFLYFAQKKPDVLLLEVGMGGAGDATNVVAHPIATVFTRISLDHTAQLGETLPQIAEEKIGIIKEGCSVYSSPQDPVVEQMIRDRAAELGCHIGVVKAAKIKIEHSAPGDFSFIYKDIPLHTTMGGVCQTENAAVAAKTAYHTLPKLLPENDYMGMKRLARIAAGIQSAYWPGRFEVIGTDPLFILDGAHNEDAAAQLEETLRLCFKEQPVTYLIGVLADKDHRSMLRRMLPHAGAVFCVTPPVDRALDGEVLAEEARELGMKAKFVPSISSAVRQAEEIGSPVLAFGTLYYLEKVRQAKKKG